MLTILLMTLPVWVATVAWRGPLFAVGGLGVLLLVVFGLAFLNRLFRRD